LGGWEQERHRLTWSAPSTAWLYATANSLCHSNALLHLKELLDTREKGREREEIEGWAGRS